MSDGLDLDPQLPPKVTGLSYVGVDYQGYTIDVHLSSQDDEISVILTEGPDEARSRLKLLVYRTEQIYSVERGLAVRYKRNKAKVFVQR